MFRLLFVLSIVVGIACGFKVPPVKLVDNRILGGENALIQDYPYQISLRVMPGNSNQHICGGSIYSNKVIVTASHCLDGFQASNLCVVVGVTYLEEVAPIFTVQKLIMHERYNRRTIDYDVGLVILSNPLTYTTKIQPIPLAESNPSTGVLVTVTGWGFTTEGGIASNQLQEVAVPMVSRATCSSAYGSTAITDRMICAGWTSGGKDACQGDSGGPLALGNTLVGVVSWGYGCGRPSYPGVYASVVNLRSWIVNSAANA